MRKLAVDGSYARRVLSPELGEAFLALVADMRVATFLGELVEAPTIAQYDPLLLHLALAPRVVLEVQPVASGIVDDKNWHGVHRLKLMRLIGDLAR